MSSGEQRTGSNRVRPGRHSDILRTTRDILVEVADGTTERVTLTEVAERAGVARTTVYRRWTSLGALILDALAEAAPEPDALTGQFAVDLHALAANRARALSEAELLGAIPLLMGDSVHGTGLASRIRLEVWAPRYGELVARYGQLGACDAPAGDVELFIELVVGGILLRRLLRGRSVSAKEAMTLVDAVLGKRYG